MSSSEVLRDLAFAKVAFQLRTIEALLTASADGRRMADDAEGGSVRSTTSAVPPQAGDAQKPQPGPLS